MSAHAVPGGQTPATNTSVSNVRANPTGGRAGLLTLQIATEVRSSLRSPEFTVGAVIIPVILYAMFGLTNASSLLPEGTRIGLAMLLSLSCYGIVTLAIVVFGEDVAKDRGRGWLRTLRATPFPTSVYLVGKVGAALVHGALIAVFADSSVDDAELATFVAGFKPADTSLEPDAGTSEATAAIVSASTAAPARVSASNLAASLTFSAAVLDAINPFT